MAILSALAYNEFMLPAEHAPGCSLADVCAALMERPRTVFPGQWAPATDLHSDDNIWADLDSPAPAAADSDLAAVVTPPLFAPLHLAFCSGRCSRWNCR